MVRPYDGDFHDDVDDGWDAAEEAWDAAEEAAFQASGDEVFDTYIPEGEEISQERCEYLAERSAGA